MSSETSTNVSVILASVVGVPVWYVFLLVTSGGPYWGSPGGTGWLFFLAPLPLGFRLLTSGSRALGAWLLALTPIITSACMVFLALAETRSGTVTKHSGTIDSIVFFVIWLLPLFSKGLRNGQQEEYIVEDSQSDNVEDGSCEIGAGEQVVSSQDGNSKDPKQSENHVTG